MKIVAVMEVSPKDGGGFHQALNAVLQMKRICEDRFVFEVAVTDPSAAPILAALGIASFHFPTSMFERLRPMLCWGRIAASWLRSSLRARSVERQTSSGTRTRPLSSAGRTVNRLLRSLPDLYGVESRLISAGADLVYFVAPWGRAHVLERLCYWVTVWDLAHLDHPEFPEVFGAFHEREKLLRHALGPAALILSDSLELGSRICHRYGAYPAQVVAMPFAPAASLHAPNARPCAEVLRNFDLEPGYLFYPAQFWAHKNHLRILQALRFCLDRGHRMRVVFAGGDMGFRSHVESAARAMSVLDQVRFLGFVDSCDMRGLYQGSLSLIMPTYFGPTNLPPLEAWSLGVPVIYSSHLAEQAGDAALLVDPDDASALADAMLSMRDDRLRSDLISRGRLRLQDIQAQRVDAEAVLLDRLRRLELRLHGMTRMPA